MGVKTPRTRGAHVAKDAAKQDVTPPPAGRSARIIGSEPVMQALYERIESVAASSAPVLVGGESGSGKDLVAHAIHARGPRRDHPFLAVNACAIPETLLESELFGHARGAFSGASEARRGLFLTADGGTIFLDEIGDMPLGLQAKLLRVLEFGEVRAIGSDSVRAVDVRVIAATHRDLTKLVETGRFRQNLYFRLNVLPIAVPPLRDRRGDIPELVRHFLEQARQRTPSSPVRLISPEAMESLSRADWPGNVRELASAVERLVVFGKDETITRGSVSFPESACARTPEPGVCSSCSLRELCSIRRLNERHVAWVLDQTGETRRAPPRSSGSTCPRCTAGSDRRRPTERAGHARIAPADASCSGVSMSVTTPTSSQSRSTRRARTI